MLSPGARIGTLEVIGPLGAGGMGEVWRAHDGRLGRDVAVKALPDDFATDEARRARFEREARLLAALNHPGIGAIYGLEQADSRPVLVLELVEGQTLAERLRRGRLSVREALEFGRQIAEALGAAHEKGIVHRDLKPSNVKVTPEGRVKLLDFGLAKALSSEVSGEELATCSTDTAPSKVGVPLGTAPYMSPEQARGEEMDRRTDVWAFGCVLYEMLAGRRAFAGTTPADVLGRVLEHEPDWSLVPQATPALVWSLLRRCLQKDRARRLQDIGDARIEIDEALDAAAPEGSDVRPPRRVGPGWLVAAVVGVALATSAVWMLLREAPSGRRPPRRFNVDLPASTPLSPTDRPFVEVALAPDGSRLVYSSHPKGAPRRLYSRPMDRLEATPIRGTETGEMPFFSPDGRWLGFTAEDKLKKVAVDGGQPSIICDVVNIRGATWGPDDTIILGGLYRGLSRVSAQGGQAQALTTPDRDKGEASHTWPQFLPGGRAVLFTIHPLSGRQDEGRVAVLSLETGERSVLVTGGTYGRYVPTGHLLYARDGTLLAAPFDLKRMQVTTTAVRILDDVGMSNLAAQFDFSLDGQLAYVAGYIGDANPPEKSLVWVDRLGRAEAAAQERRAYETPRLSPDGRSLVVTVYGSSTSDLWRYDLQSRAWARLTFEKDNFAAALSPDGRVVFGSNRSGPGNLYWMPAEGGPVERLTTNPTSDVATGWAPDGRALLFERRDPESWDIWVLPVDGDRRAKPLVATRFHERSAVFSPDGAWLAYVSTESGSGRSEVYVRSYSAPDQKWRLSTDGGFMPKWSSAGGEVFYRIEDRLMAVKLTTRPAFHADSPRVLFSGQFAGDYAVTPDGQRFLMVQEGDDVPKPRMVVIPDWFAELEARVPAPSR